MTFTVEGTLGGAPYTCQVGPTGQLGKVSGTGNVMELLVRREGDHYAATPTGPFGQLDCGKPSSVFGALLAWTSVDLVHGIMPDILGGQPQPGTVY